MKTCQVSSFSTWGDWRLVASVSPVRPSPSSSALSCDFGPSVLSRPEPVQPHLRVPKPAGPSAPHPGPRPLWRVSGAATDSHHWKCSPSRPSCSSSRPAATTRKGPPPRRGEGGRVRRPSGERREKVAYNGSTLWRSRVEFKLTARSQSESFLTSVIIMWRETTYKYMSTECVPKDSCHTWTVSCQSWFFNPTLGSEWRTALESPLNCRWQPYLSLVTYGFKWDTIACGSAAFPLTRLSFSLTK